ncbi:exo-rhamnogalacturonase B [Ephemerocybe angulata]|uniref:galacturonan 1,4-alpha-galacturonidase n=1 Tax=Ephemerocybe angulata TaxID=980116 RepID=A0A8H6HDN8_9AGAR|nr:exo-rhamnogalacturonase B [Tulosesus angulatus]
MMNLLKVFSLLIALSARISYAAQPIYGQCGGTGYSGDTTCVSGAVCTKVNDFYYQCLPGTQTSTGSTTTTTTTTTTTGGSTTTSTPVATPTNPAGQAYATTCTLAPLSPTQVPSGGKPPDDTPRILDVFKRCQTNASITLSEGFWYIGQVMDTLNFRDVEINLLGRFEWSTDIQYWLRNSISVTYAQRSTAWRLGGTNVQLLGHGKALFFGNGQTWYDQNQNQGNQAGRPISLTVWRGTNILIDGITWRQPQFWHTFVANSDNVTMTNLDMNATSATRWSTVNTDGTNTWNSRNIFIKNWVVTSGDDCICAKGNTTNMHVNNVTCHESGCMVVGSLGNPTNVVDNVDNVLFENIKCIHSSNAAWIKTYAGTGRVNNITFRNFEFDDVNQPIYLTPCIYTGQNCDGSRLGINNVRWENIKGTSRYNIGAAIHCSAAAPCQNFTFSGIDIKQKNGGGAVKYLGSNIANQASSGLAFTGTCAANWPQQLDGNR